MISCKVLFVVLALLSVNSYAEGLQDAINKGSKIIVLKHDYEITNTLSLPSNTILDGNGYQIHHKGTGAAISITGRSVKRAKTMRRTLAGGGLKSLKPRLYINDSSLFNKGDQIKIVSPKRLVGFNSIESIASNYIVLSDRFKTAFPAGSIVFAWEPASNITITNLELTGSNSESSGIIVNDSKGLVIKNSHIYNLGRDAILINNSFYPMVKDIVLEKNGKAGSGDDAIGVSYSYGAKILNNTLLNSGAIVLRGSTHSTIDGNFLDSSGLTGGDGISLVGAVYSRITNNTISRANCYGLWAKRGSNYNIISSNVFSSGITSGIFLSHEASYNILSSNIVSNNNGNGLFIDFKAENNIVTNLISSGNNSRGVLVHGKNNIINTETINSFSNGLENFRLVGGTIKK